MGGFVHRLLQWQGETIHYATSKETYLIERWQQQERTFQVNFPFIRYYLLLNYSSSEKINLLFVIR